jgi:hypothetical protein
MARALSPQNAAEFEQLDGYLRFYVVYCKRQSESVYEQSLAAIVKEFGRSKALVGLRQAVNDTLEDLAHANAEAIELLDQALTERGLVSFSSLRRRYSAQYKRLLKRGIIRNDTEFYMASGVASDLAADVPDNERTKLQEMVQVYERAV